MKLADEDLKIFLQHKEFFINEYIKNGDNFLDCIEILENNHKEKWAEYLIPTGFLASRCAEFYIKAYLLHYQLDKDMYIGIRKCSHNLYKLYQIAINFDRNFRIFEEDIETLNKYSGDKVIYPEQIFRDLENEDTKIYGNDFIFPIRKLKDYVKNKIYH